MKNIIIIVVVAVALGIAWLVFSFCKRGVAPSPVSSSTESLPPVGRRGFPGNRPTGAILQIGTPKGAVSVKNFYNHPVSVSQDNTSIVVTQSNAYIITYYAPDSSFNIGIIKRPVSVVRAEAEAAFLNALGISEADACKLNVMIGVPYKVDPAYSLQNLGLGFCSGGTVQRK